MPSLIPGADTGGAWPAVTFETVDWTPTVPLDLLSNRQRAKYRGPYRAALVQPIARRAPTIATAVSNLASEAGSAVTRFDAELGHEIAPFGPILLRSESASSSRIENLSSGAKQIALAELGSRDKRNATEIVDNVAAMTAALRLADSLDTEAILAMHRALMERHAPDLAGEWRSSQVWIGGGSIGPHDADYVAPLATRVPPLMDDLVEFIRRDDIPPLAIAAIAHAQFETIHPFPDGNGRTGRALLQSMLRAAGVTRNVTVPVSAGLLHDTERYFDALDAYRIGDVAPIIEVVALAAQSAVVNGSLLVADLHRIRSEWGERVRSRRGSSARRLLDVLLRQPVIDARTAAAEIAVSPANVGRAIGPLVDAGVLREFTGFDRNRMWQATDVTDALDAFATRAVRRGLPSTELFRMRCRRPDPTDPPR